MGSDQNRFLINERIIDPHSLTIAHGNNQQTIEPRVLDVFLLLLKSQGQLVTRETIISEVWRGRHASDNSLNRNIASLRKLLDNPESDVSIIKTIPKKGYMLIDEVEIKRIKKNQPLIPIKPSSIVYLLLIVSVFGILLTMVNAREAEQREREPTIAIQFEYLSHNTDIESDIDVIASHLLDALLEIKGIKVSSIIAKQRDNRLQTNLEKPNPDYLLRTIRTEGDEDIWNISIYLIDMQQSAYIWSQRLQLKPGKSTSNQAIVNQAIQDMSARAKLGFFSRTKPSQQATFETNSQISLHPKEKTRAFCLDGVDDFVEIPHSDELNFDTGDYAITSWIKTSSLATNIIIDKRDEKLSGNVRGYNVHIYNGFIGTQMADGNGEWYCSLDPKISSCTNYLGRTFIADNQWHFVAISVDRDSPNGLKIYVDGQLDIEFDPRIRANSLSNLQPLRIGSRSSFVSSLFKGSIGEVSIHQYALSESEVSMLHNKGASRHCELPQTMH